MGALLMCGRAAAMMTYDPTNTKNITSLLFGILISTIIEVALLVPIVCFQKKFAGYDPCTLAMQKNKIFGTAINLIYLIYFMFCAFMVIGDFVYLVDFYLANFLGRTAIVILITAAAIYMANMNISVFGRTSSIIFTLFLIFTGIILISTATEFKWENLYIQPFGIKENMPREIFAEFARNRILVTAIFVLPNINGNSAKSFAMYLAVKFLLVESILIFVTIILGDFGVFSRLPFFSLASYNSNSIIERFDAIFMFMWVLMTLVTISIFFHCSGKALKNILPKLKINTANIVTAVIPTIISAVILNKHKWNTMSGTGTKFGIWQALILILLISVIPFFMLILKSPKPVCNDSDKG